MQVRKMSRSAFLWILALAVTGLLIVWRIYEQPVNSEDLSEVSSGVNQGTTENNKVLKFQHGGLSSETKPLVKRCKPYGETGNTNDVVVKTFDEEWKIDNSICSGLDEKLKTKYFYKTILPSVLGNMTIYTHYPKDETYSRKKVVLQRHEPHIFKTLYGLLRLDPYLNLVDVGAYIGINAIQAAKYGRQAIAIEATTESTQHICANAREGKYFNKLTVIHNAISNIHTTVKFVHATFGKYDSSFMDDGAEMRKLKVASDGNWFNFSQYTTYKTMVLDDLLDLPNICDFKRVLIKMDIEGSEHKALLGATKFFQQADVQGVLMEYNWHRKRDSKYVIWDFFKQFKFVPFDFMSGRLKRLNPKTMQSYDVLWLPIHRVPMLDNMQIWDNAG